MVAIWRERRGQTTVCGDRVGSVGGADELGLFDPDCSTDAARPILSGSARYAPSFYDAGLSDRADDLRKAGLVFCEVRLPPLHWQSKGYLAGIFLFSSTTFPRELAYHFASFLIWNPGRRVCVSLGDKKLTLTDYQEVLHLLQSFPGDLTHVL